MIGLDTNIVVRLFIDDHQSEAAQRFIAERCTPQTPGFVNVISLCEAAWVLQSVYRFDRQSVIDVIADLVASDDIVVEEIALVKTALAAYRTGRVSFADLLIGEVNRARGCRATATFDRSAARLPTFIPVQ